MRVSEIFLSIQGEGRLAGVVSVFVRLAGCDLHCRWCDTPYALRATDGVVMSVGEVVEQVKGYSAEHVVVTGGEPFLSSKLAGLCEGLKGLGRHVTIETAGTRFEAVAADLMSISPKLSNSRPRGGEQERYAAVHEARRLNLEVIGQFLDGYACQLKFVVADADDVVEVKGVVAKLGDVAREDIMLMPLAASKDEYDRVGPEVAGFCIAEGFRFCPRLHLELWDARRGK